MKQKSKDPIGLYMQRRNSVIGRLISIDPYNDHPHLYQYAVEYSDAGRRAKEALMEPNALDEDECVARERCILEAIERHYLVDSPLQKKTTKEQKYSQIDSSLRPVSPTTFAIPHYSSNQNWPREQIEEGPYRWLRVNNHTTRSTAHIPSQLVLWPSEKDGEILLRDIDTTGTAAGYSYAQAWTNAALELCERESFAILYYTHAARHRIALSPDHPSHHLSYLIEQYGFEVVLIEMVTDLPIHVVSCWLINTSDIGPYLTVGVSAHFSQSQAIHKSILEALQSQTNARNMQTIDTILDKTKHPRQFFSRPYMRRATVRNMLLWSHRNADTEKYIRSLKQLGLDHPIKTNEVKHAVSTTNMNLLLSSLRSQGVTHIYGVDISPDLERDGLCVVRAVIPELAPLSLKERYWYPPTSRIFSVPRKLGIKHIDNQDSFSNIPHPFP